MAEATGSLIDSNILLDVATEDPAWFEWSSRALTAAIRNGPVLINPLIYAEVSVAFDRIEELEAALPADVFHRAALPWSGAFLAGKAFRAYRRRGGARTSPLPDFYVGAHAAIDDLTLVTRDAARYRTYFPSVRLVTPHPPAAPAEPT